MKQILVVDDSPVIRKVTRRILEAMHKFQISEAEDGKQALDACAFLMPDAIFVDGHMPVLDGFEFVKQLRKMPGGTTPRIVFCMSENDVAQTARARYYGADEFMLKPFDREVLESKIADIGLAA
ncbi:MAG: response regulator [Methylobacteriaceae bacterium]|nr:response regulator [Methylobacteriaceae bacterium]